jgi:hypothetical protein
MPNPIPYSKWSADGVITATDVTTIVFKTVRSANHQLFITRISWTVTTHANAKVLITIQSSNATPVVVYSHTDLTGAAGVLDSADVYPGGELGVPIVKGESAHWLWSTGGSGPVGRVHVEGYEKLIGPVAVASTN